MPENEIPPVIRGDIYCIQENHAIAVWFRGGEPVRKNPPHMVIGKWPGSHKKHRKKRDKESGQLRMFDSRDLVMGSK